LATLKQGAGEQRASSSATQIEMVLSPVLGLLEGIVEEGLDVANDADDVAADAVDQLAEQRVAKGSGS
jgi:hypothetical protein